MEVGYGDPASRVTRLGGQPACSYQLLFFQPCVYMIGGVTRQGGLSGLPCRVTCLAEVAFCHVNGWWWGIPATRVRALLSYHQNKYIYGCSRLQILKTRRDFWSVSSAQCKKANSTINGFESRKRLIFKRRLSESRASNTKWHCVAKNAVGEDSWPFEVEVIGNCDAFHSRKSIFFLFSSNIKCHGRGESKLRAGSTSPPPFHGGYSRI